MKNNDLNNKTGYPTVDKPWLKYHREKLLREFDVNQTFEQLLKVSNRDNLSSNAINFMGFEGNSWTYRELFRQANKLADAYRKNGVKEGSTVLIATVSGMEEALNLIALNQLGAVSKWVDITYSGKELEEAINSDECEFVVCFALVVPELQKILHDTDVKKVLYVDPSQYMRPFKVLMHSHEDLEKMKKMAEENEKNPLPEMPDDKRYMPFTDFIKEGSGFSNIHTTYEKDRPTLKIQSSGTTGKPKVIVHTDYSINNSIRKFSGTDLPLYPNHVMLKTAPAWVGYGLINTLGVGLAYGMEVMTTPLLNADILYQYNQKYDVVFGVPLHYRYLSAHIDEIDSMTRPSALISGGDKISKSEIETFEEQFKDKGCTSPIINGAGNNEVLGAGVVNPVNANRPGSVGIPMYDEDIGIFDPDTLEEKKYYEEGEVCYRTESAFFCYDHNKELTDGIKMLHPDGSIWIHSKDLGYMDEDGFVFLNGRLERVISVGSFKISAGQIEDVIQTYPAVQECVAVAVPDKENGEVPMAHIVLKEQFKEEQDFIIEEIKELCKKELKERAVPEYFNILDKMPYTSNNKQDFRKLEEMGKQILKEQVKTKSYSL